MARLRFHASIAIVVAFAAISACAHRSAAPAALVAPPPLFTDTPADIQHALARLTYGERPGDVARVHAMTLDAWLRDQLAAPTSEDPSRALAASRYPLAFEAPLTLRFGAIDVGMEASDGDDAMASPEPPPNERRRRSIQDTQLATVFRQATSERQLDEVLVEFWANHFHVGIEKGACAYLTANYVESAIRPNVRGRFEDMLRAVAQHPAMLVYLDNARSSTERPGANGEHGGLNENYARELMELHTLGVNGGYTQADVRESARVLTGWGEQEFDFTFRAAWHDRGEKTVLGHAFAAGRGQDEGLELLHLLATHPSTARFVARKLLQRFVTDTPSDAAVERVAGVFVATDGDLDQVTRAVILGPEFWATEHRRTKVRSGLEFFLALVRATGATIDGPRAIRALDRLGQAPFRTLVPTGYPEVGSAWADPGRISTRWAIVYQFASQRLPDVGFVPTPDTNPDEIAREFTAPEFEYQ